MLKEKVAGILMGCLLNFKFEKRLGIKKEDIGTKISIEDYNEACKEDVT